MSHDNLDQQLSNHLHDRADRYDPSPITFDRVRKDAGRLRRRRASAVGAALAVTIVGGGGGVVMALQGGDEAGDLQVASPSFTGAATATMPPANELPVNKGNRNLPGVDPTVLPTGGAPRLGWLQDGVLHTADGTQVQLTADYGSLHRYGDGWLGIDFAGAADSATGQVLDADGREVGPAFETSGKIAHAADGSTVLFMAGDELTLHDNESGETTVVRAGMDPLTEPVGVDDAGAVYYNHVDPETYAEDGRIWRDDAEVDPSPGTDQALLAVNGQGFTTRLVDLDDYGTCTAVFDAAGTEQARTCDWLPTAFSPDGTKLIFGPAYGDGFGDLEYGIVGADWSQPLVERVNYDNDGKQGMAFMQSAWEDDEHTLVVMAGYPEGATQMAWWVVRIGVDGEAELALGPIEAGEDAGISLVD